MPNEGGAIGVGGGEWRTTLRLLCAPLVRDLLLWIVYTGCSATFLSGLITHQMGVATVGPASAAAAVSGIVSPLLLGGLVDRLGLRWAALGVLGLNAIALCFTLWVSARPSAVGWVSRPVARQHPAATLLAVRQSAGLREACTLAACVVCRSPAACVHPAAGRLAALLRVGVCTMAAGVRCRLWPPARSDHDTAQVSAFAALTFADAGGATVLMAACARRFANNPALEQPPSAVAATSTARESGDGGSSSSSRGGREGEGGTRRPLVVATQPGNNSSSSSSSSVAHGYTAVDMFSLLGALQSCVVALGFLCTPLVLPPGANRWSQPHFAAALGTLGGLEALALAAFVCGGGCQPSQGVTGAQ
jgi:hypothetical protein